MVKQIIIEIFGNHILKNIKKKDNQLRGLFYNDKKENFGGNLSSTTKEAIHIGSQI
jgi:hypothetical protein